ncbi:efflux RND transporter periplasmic adaptor subunit [Pseudoduganella ginsengisoli]|uniref:HlyD family efflux transporter periplasmic adaptor subunit n=1 Tax=Pseudoduganella ginsengisoli TaxID=1462440 RepID=A0A6L6PU23_9BURK|nr:HlyD family efflux transporter periplasmic adaptor subunit [Pseudoduganella ginsengisoli]MTW00739.1 HlyD family efflux transporter periplasmic adaptor subunit [Pseudoduganella ginsengisoli]
MDQALSPAIVAQRRRRTAGTVAAGLALLCGTAWGLRYYASPSASTRDIAVAEVRRGNIANSISATGVVVPEREETVPAPIPSRIAHVHAKPGQQVAAGDLLLSLDDGSVRVTIASLQEQLAQQENRMTGLRVELEQKRKQTKAAMELLELDLQSARAKLNRSQLLRKAGGISGEDMLAAELNVKRIEVQLRQQQEFIDDTARVNASTIADARLQKAILQKQLDQQLLVQQQTQVRAPFAGMLTSLAADEGAAVVTGQMLAKVADLQHYRVEAAVSDFHARRLGSGLAVQVEHNGQVLSGRVHTVLPEIRDGKVTVLTTLDQPGNPMLRNRMRVDVRIITDQKQGVLLADNGAAFNGQGRQQGYVLRDGVARKVTLDIGASDGKAVEIVSGAQAGDRLIISDISRYKEHDTLRITN